MKKRELLVSGSIGLLLVMSFLLSLCWGKVQISFSELIQVFFGEGSDMQRTAIYTIRLPRILLGMFVAAAFAVSGGILQTMTKNALADSGILGINAGAAVAAALFIQIQTGVYYSELKEKAVYVLPVMAILGAMLAAFFVCALSCRKGLQPKRLLLMGIGVNAGLNAFLTFFLFRRGNGEYNKILIWTTGSLWGASWNYIRIFIPIVVPVACYVFWKSRTMDAMHFSDETAVGWGIEVQKERRRMLVCAVILAGAATAFAGNIAFLGLLAPHLAKKLVGNCHRKFLPVSAIIAAILMLFADAVSRNLFSPIEIPAGIMISIVGVPYFVSVMGKEEQ